MEVYAGLDVGLKVTSIAVVAADGRVVWRGRESSHPEMLARALARGHALQGAPDLKDRTTQTAETTDWRSREVRRSPARNGEVERVGTSARLLVALRATLKSAFNTLRRPRPARLSVPNADAAHVGDVEEHQDPASTDRRSAETP